MTFTNDCSLVQCSPWRFLYVYTYNIYVCIYGVRGRVLLLERFGQGDTVTLKLVRNYLTGPAAIWVYNQTSWPQSNGIKFQKSILIDHDHGMTCCTMDRCCLEVKIVWKPSLKIGTYKRGALLRVSKLQQLLNFYVFGQPTFAPRTSKGTYHSLLFLVWFVIAVVCHSKVFKCRVSKSRVFWAHSFDP